MIDTKLLQDLTGQTIDLLHKYKEALDAHEKSQAKPDYTILSFKSKMTDEITKRDVLDNNKFSFVNTPFYTTEAMLRFGNPIHSVRRNSDNTVWTVGERVCIPGDNAGITQVELEIISFYIEDDCMWARMNNPVVSIKLTHLRKIEKPKYQIWEFKHVPDDFLIRYDVKDDLFHNRFLGVFFTEKEMLGHKDFVIFSVKRNTDNTFWTIGEETDLGKILGFSIKDGCMAVRCKKYTQDGDWFGLLRLNKQTPAKAPWFTTADGKDIFEDDSFFRVNIDFSIDGPIKTSYHNISVQKYRSDRCFSSEQAAKAFVLSNKRCLSLHDVELLVDAPHQIAMEKLEELAKQRITLK